MCLEIFILWIMAYFPAWEEFCRWFDKRSAYFSSLSPILFTDQTRFGIDGMINIHKQHQRVEQNPHGVIHFRHQQEIRINMWASIVSDGFSTPAYRQPLPKFRLTLSAETTGKCTTGSQSMNVIYAWWSLGTL